MQGTPGTSEPTRGAAKPASPLWGSTSGMVASAEPPVADRVAPPVGRS